jgi:hypothetical protein
MCLSEFTRLSGHMLVPFPNKFWSSHSSHIYFASPFVLLLKLLLVLLFVQA